MKEKEWYENEKNLSIKEIVKLESNFRIDSLIVAIEEILINKDEVTDSDINEEELLVIAIQSFEREINNGGFLQFFSNESKMFIPFILKFLNQINATKTEKLASKAIQTLNVQFDGNPNVFFEKIENALEDENIEEKLGELDELYYITEESIETLLFSFIKYNIEKYT
jgi:hypothetical protein